MHGDAEGHGFRIRQLARIEEAAKRAPSDVRAEIEDAISLIKASLQGHAKRER